MKHLVGKKLTKKVKFVGEEVVIKKLSVTEVMKLQEAYNDAAAGDELVLLRTVIRQAVEGAEDLTDEDLSSFPIDELANLSNEIIKFSGMDKGTATGN
jgi:hypothetical protein